MQESEKKDNKKEESKAGVNGNNIECSSDSTPAKKKLKKDKNKKHYSSETHSEATTSSGLSEEIDRLEIDDSSHKDEANEISKPEMGENEEDEEVFPIIGDYKFKKKHKV